MFLQTIINAFKNIFLIKTQYNHLLDQRWYEYDTRLAERQRRIWALTFGATVRPLWGHYGTTMRPYGATVRPLMGATINQSGPKRVYRASAFQSQL